MSSCETCGWLAAFGSMLAFGSFGVPIKSKRAVSVNIDPLVFQSYKTSMCFLTCWLVLLAGVPFTYTPWGIVSGMFWVPGGVATVYAIKVAGLAIAIGVGSCFIVLVSFTWGIFIFGEEVHSKVGASFAIVCMMSGLYGMAYYSSPESAVTTTTRDPPSSSEPNERSVPSVPVAFSELATTCGSDEGDEGEGESMGLSPSEIEQITLTERTVESHETDFNKDAASVQDRSEEGECDIAGSDEEITGPCHPTEEVDDSEPTEPTYVHVCGFRILERNAGILAALVFTGIWGGSILVPMKWAPESATGMNFLISFAIGASIVTIALWIARISYSAHFYGSWEKAISSMPSFHLGVMWLPGGLSGTLWSIGNFCSILSVYYLGEGVGYPLSQTSILVSGLWGIFYFREIKSTRRIMFWLLSSCSTIFGILLLSYEHVK